MAQGQITWLALAYNVPINPSKNRVYVWRKLKEFGAGYFKQGVAILPRNTQSQKQFGVLAAKIRDMGGEAVMAELRFLDPADEARTVRGFREQSQHEYLELMRDCANLIENIQHSLAPAERSEHIKRIAKRYGKVQSRDYFKSAPGTDLAGILDELAGDIAHSAGELLGQLRGLMD